MKLNWGIIVDYLIWDYIAGLIIFNPIIYIFIFNVSDRILSPLQKEAISLGQKFKIYCINVHWTFIHVQSSCLLTVYSSSLVQKVYSLCLLQTALPYLMIMFIASCFFMLNHHVYCKLFIHIYFSCLYRNCLSVVLLDNETSTKAKFSNC